MITEELLEFLRAQYASGMSGAEMEHLLLTEGGWSKEDITEAFRKVGIAVQTPVEDFPAVIPSPDDTKILVEEHVHSVGTTLAPFSQPVLPPQESHAPSDPVQFLAPIAPEEETPSAVLPPLEVAPQSSPTSPTSKELTPVVAEVSTPSQSQEFEVSVNPTPPPSTSSALTPLTERLAPASTSIVEPNSDRALGQISPLLPPSPTTPPIVLPVIHATPARTDEETAIESEGSGDDFLGIFGTTTPELVFSDVTKPQVDAPPEAPTVVEMPGQVPAEETTISGPSMPSISQDVALTPTMSETPSDHPREPVPLSGKEIVLDDVKEDMGDIAEQSTNAGTSSVREDAPIVFGKKPEWSLQDVLTEKKGQVPPPTSPSLVQDSTSTYPSQVTEEKAILFDLSRVGSLPPSRADQSVTLAQPESAPVAKPVETRSVADVWLSGTNTGDQSHVPYTSTTPRGTIQTRRTMNSDLLLRGRGGANSAMPAISEDKLPSPVPMPVTPLPERPAVVTKSPVVPSEASLAEALKRKNRIKEIAPIVLGVLLLGGLVWGLVWFVLSHRGPSTEERLASALRQFAETTSFAYEEDGFMDLTFSSTESGASRSGVAKFILRSAGALRSSESGFGDGTHRFKLTGGLQSGNFVWDTDVESDVRLIGDALFFHLLAYPAVSEFDPEVMNTYWVKIDLSALAQELMLAGMSGKTEGYGNFGLGKADMSFANLYATHMPFTIAEIAPDEEVGGVTAMHYQLKAVPDRMSAFALMLYKKYSGSELVLTADQQLRLKNALGKIVGDIWIDPATNTIVKVVVRGSFDDDMVSVHIKGNTQLTFALKDHRKDVVVSEPTPFLTLEEFRTRTDDYKKSKELRARDVLKLGGLDKIISALSAYQKEKGRFPTTLLDLRSSDKLPVSVLDDFALKSYVYVSYITPEQLTKKGRCPTKGNSCSFYHLGVTFEDVRNPALSSDADVTSDIFGKDTSGCIGELDRSCFDVVSTSLAPAPTSSTTTPAL